MTDLCKGCQNLITWELPKNERLNLKYNKITYCGANIKDARKCLFNKERIKND